MSDELRKELDAVRQTVAALTTRVQALERRGVSPAPMPKPAAPPLTVSPRPVPAPSTSRESWETTIGRYWLNWVGIGSLVLGMAFFILYTFQYFGVIAKLATGAVMSMLLVAVGQRLERRATLRRFGLGLIGGGWALLYFTVYAMHHVPEVRVLESAVADVVLLAAVAAGAIWHSLRYRSQVITALALSLGFVTVAISHVTFFTLAASLVLLAAMAWLVVRMGWHQLALFGVVVSYATFLACLQPNILQGPFVTVHWANVFQAQFWLRAGFLGMYWAIHHGVQLALASATGPRRRAVVTAALVNGLAFVYLGLQAMDPVYRDWRWVFAAIVGSCYVLSESLAQRRGVSALGAVYTVLGLSLLSLAIPLKLSGRWVSMLWTMEVALFAFLGLREQRWSYRLFAAGLGVLVFVRLLFKDLWVTSAIPVWQWEISWRLMIGTVGIAAFGASAGAYRWPAFQRVARPMERQAFHGYVLAAATVLWWLTLAEAPSRWVPLWWAVEAVLLTMLGMELRDRVVRLVGVLEFGLTALLVLMAAWFTVMVSMAGRAPDWEPLAALGVAALCGAMTWLYRPERTEGRFGLADLWTICGALLLTLWLWVEVPSRWLSLAWAVEGLALVAGGFAWRERTLRLSGLAVFGALVIKILVVDLAEAETIYRILSFLVAGAMFLGASFAYNRWLPKKAK